MRAREATVPEAEATPSRSPPAQPCGRVPGNHAVDALQPAPHHRGRMGAPEARALRLRAADPGNLAQDALMLLRMTAIARVLMDRRRDAPRPPEATRTRQA